MRVTPHERKILEQADEYLKQAMELEFLTRRESRAKIEYDRIGTAAAKEAWHVAREAVRCQKIVTQREEEKVQAFGLLRGTSH